MNAPAIKPTPIDPVAAFELRAWARAKLYAEGQLDLLEAVDVLQADAELSGLVQAIGQDRVQAIITEAFQILRKTNE